MEVSQILRESGKLIEKGWVRGQYSHAGRHCALGAIQKTITGDAWNISSPQRAEILKYLAQVMREQFDGLPSNDGFAIVTCNDDIAKNRREIVACFEKAAMLAE